MQFSPLDWIIIIVFFLVLIIAAMITKRMTRSVAGFLSGERLAGRYMLTIAIGMAYCSAIAVVNDWEAFYRQGITSQWWPMMGVAILVVLGLFGWVTYRYRQTRAMTMGQFLEMRYSRRFRIFAGIMAFISGILNCAVFPMVTAHFFIWFMGLPEHFQLLGLTISTYHTIMFVMIAFAVYLAVSGGQITIMVTGFLQGLVANVACLALIGYVLWRFGLNNILDTMLESESLFGSVNPENLTKINRVPGTSVLHPFKIADVPDFGLWYFIMIAFMNMMLTGVWQGAAGYMTAARTPHESKMGHMLGHLRYLTIQVGTLAAVMLVYTVMWNPDYAHLRDPITQVTNTVSDGYLQSRIFMPVALSKLLPSGMLGLMTIFMIGASISTDDSYYHSWGGTFLQDIVLPLRKKPFTQAQHLKYLRLSIVGIGVFAFLFSSFWTLVDYIMMWFQITGTIYVGGAASAIIGGLYWKRSTTAGAWAGMITGSVLSVGGIIVKQVVKDITIAGFSINSLHIAVFSIFISMAVFVIVSLITCRKSFNMDRLLHRGKFQIEEDVAIRSKAPWIERIFGITHEFTLFDKLIYVGVYAWITGWIAVFVVGTAWNVSQDVPSSAWRWWWSIHLKILITAIAVMAVWFGIGSIRDIIRFFKDLRLREVHQEDDGTVSESE